MKVISQHQSNGLHEKIAKQLYPTHQLICSKLIVAIEELFVQPSTENNLPFWDDCKGITRWHAVIRNGQVTLETSPNLNIAYPGDDKIDAPRVWVEFADDDLVLPNYVGFYYKFDTLIEAKTFIIFRMYEPQVVWESE